MRSPLNTILKKYPEGRIWQYYGENPELYKVIKLAFHNGIDIATFDGDNVLAATSGIVVEVKEAWAGYGYHVRIVSDKQPDGTYFETTYGHLRADIPVKVGDRVEEGQVIGYESNTGYVISGQSEFWGNAPAGKGVHLHFGVRILKDLEPGNQISYSNGSAFTILNYNNGVYGAIDPMLYLTNMYPYTLYKNPLKTSEIYAVIGTTKRHIANYFTLSQGKGVEWDYSTTNDIPFADVTAFAALTEGAEIVFTPHD